MKSNFPRATGLVVLLLASAAPAFPQGLADTAKKEQARRKKATTPGTTKVYTESDLPAPPPGGTPSAARDQNPTEKQTAGAKGQAIRATSEERRQQEIAELGAMAAELQARVSFAEAQVQQLASHPTGGGKICRIPEGVFQPGATAPEQVVCPYQMESRYDRAKRELEAAKAELAKFQEMARRAGIRN